jgi:hypothetical protein
MIIIRFQSPWNNLVSKLLKRFWIGVVVCYMTTLKHAECLLSDSTAFEEKCHLKT